MAPQNKLPLRLGFIGGGVNSAIGYTHFNASRMDGCFQLDSGCFSRDPEVSAQSAMAYGIAEDNTYTDWQAFLTDQQGKIDAVAILTPIPHHLGAVCEAIKLGIPVICEKPLALSTRECAEIQDVLAAHQGYLAVTLNYSGYPMVRQLRDMIQKGLLGDLQQIVIEMPQEGFVRSGANPQHWRRKDYDVPTVSLDLGVHVHHLVDFISSGLMPVRVCANHANFGAFDGLIDNVYCLAEYERGLQVQCWWGKTSMGHRNGLRLRVYGSKAGAEWYQMDPEFLKWADNSGRCYTLDRSSGDAELASEVRYNRFKAGHPSGFVEAFANLYRDIAEDIRLVQDCLLPNPAEGFVSYASHGARALSFLEDVTLSAESKRWVECRQF